MASLGVKYVIDRTENPKDNTTFSKDRFKEIWHQADWTIYENIKSAPRYFLTDTVLPYETMEEFEKEFFAPSFDPSKTVLLLKSDALTLPALKGGTAKAELVSYKPNTIIFKTVSDTTQFFYLSDTYDYGWTVTIDGNKTFLYKANYAFRGIVVPNGTHTIIFSYQPKSFTWGIRLALIGIGFLIFYSLWQYASAQNVRLIGKNN